jgi:hypothetical protein
MVDIPSSFSPYSQVGDRGALEVQRWSTSSPGAAAKVPVIVTGGGVHLLGATGELAGLSDILGMPT